MTSFVGLLTRTSRLHARSSLFSPRPVLFRRSIKAAPKIIAVGGLGLCFAVLTKPTIFCDARQPLEIKPKLNDYPPPPQSSVSVMQLTFGSLTGICAGIFIKKGAKAVAWLLGGIFILLQYLGSASLIRVDWGKIGTRFEDLVYVRDSNGNRRPPTLSSTWYWLIDFLTADFQPRASFIAGLALGLRLG
ncbi:hypothetical protein APHAL10511_001255 [Amanita phalloides]|nr:hypothetical protein APHAL10511_001255 [Amanita phalloides]